MVAGTRTNLGEVDETHDDRASVTNDEDGILSSSMRDDTVRDRHRAIDCRVDRKADGRHRRAEERPDTVDSSMGAAGSKKGFRLEERR